MNLRRTILLASVAVNVGFAAVLIRDLGSTSKPEAVSTDPADSPAVVLPVPLVSKDDREATIPSSTVQTNSANATFSWSQLESEDYKEYIARLRAFGVSERSIRDIIFAEVQKLYRPKFAALRPPKKSSDTNFWQNRNFYGPYANSTKEQREQMSVLQKEQKELLKTLLGNDVYQEIAKDSGYPDWTERQFGSLPDELRDKVTQMQQRFQEATSEIHAKTQGYFDQDTQADLKALQRKFRDELGTVLTPEQVQEYELRSSDIANNLRWQLGPFDSNEQEFRAIFNYKQAQEDLNPPRNTDDEDKHPSAEEMKARQEKQKELDVALASALGPERLKEYKLMEQWEYRNLFEAGIAKESVLKVVDMKQQVEDAANKLRQDKTLTPEQRAEALKAIRSETEKSLAEILGERRAKAYSGNGGYWLRHLAPRE
jgi:hypothetical protein